MGINLMPGFGAFTVASSGGLNGSESDGTNLVTGGNNFGSGWFDLGTIRSTNDVVAPNGATEALRITENGGVGRHAIYQIVAITDAVHTASVYAKYNDRRYLALFLSNDGGTASEAIGYFDLQTGAVTDTDQFGSPQSVATSIATGANGFYKCTVQFRLHSSVTSCYYILAMSDVATYGAPLSSGNPSYDGSSGAYVWAWRPKIALGSF